MSVFQRGETYIHRIDVRNRNSVLTTPASIKENIYDQCGHQLIKSQSMTSDAIGKFYYTYNITSNATYGRYYSRATAKDTGGYISIFTDEYYVLPWDGVQDVRQTMGLVESKSMDDDTIANSLWNSYQYALRDVFIYHDERPGCNPDTGQGFDGSNTTFKAPHYPIADITGDGIISNSCPSDITSIWVDSDGASHYASVVVNNADFGEISIYQIGGVTAIPSDNRGVRLIYWSEPERYNEYLYQQAAVRLCCYELSKRMGSLNEITLAMITSNNPLIVLDPDMWMKEYKRYLKTNRELVIGGV